MNQQKHLKALLILTFCITTISSIAQVELKSQDRSILTNDKSYSTYTDVNDTVNDVRAIRRDSLVCYTEKDSRVMLDEMVKGIESRLELVEVKLELVGVMNDLERSQDSLRLYKLKVDNLNLEKKLLWQKSDLIQEEKNKYKKKARNRAWWFWSFYGLITISYLTGTT